MRIDQSLPRLSLVVNAGGQSQRMGRSKALLPTPPNGKPLISHVVKRLGPLVAEKLVVVTNDPDLQTKAGLPRETLFLPDAFPGTGTLGGIATGLHAVDEWAIVVACDLPLVSAQLFALLAHVAAEQEASGDRWDAVVPVVAEYEEPLHALYHRRCLSAIEERLRQGQRRVISFMGDVRTRYVAEAEMRSVDPELRSFLNANTPEEWQVALAMLERENER